MNIRQKMSGALLVSVLLAGAASASAITNPTPHSALFGSILSPTESFQEVIIEKDNALRRKALTDSLLNATDVDSLTIDVYSKFTPHYNKPRILGSLMDYQPVVIEAVYPTYPQLAGIVHATEEGTTVEFPAAPPAIMTDAIPDWLKMLLRQQNAIHNASYTMMLTSPQSIEFSDWDLPHPPVLPAQDYSFHGFLKRLNLPEISVEDAIIPEIEHPRTNWLHYFNVGLQLSQAYVSSNWYQGGNSYVAGLFNFTWNVELNTVYHPNLLFQSAFQYKLGVNSNPKGSLHKYNTSQDLLQYTLKTGLKAFNHWFYSLNILFQTQLFNSYPDDSMQRSSSFLSPGTLNVGLGMTYTLDKANKGLKLTASISPLAYNLKTCIASDIDHAQFNIAQDRKTLSEIGSSAEVNLTWNFNSSISWKSRLFLFSDYSYFLADWENTFNFQLNKLFSTQIFLHPRFDSSSEIGGSKWKHWMLHEILSFGISYTFSTKPS